MTLNSFTLMASHSDKRTFKVFLSLGSNLGNKKDQLLSACEAIKKQVGSIIVASSIYETAPWGDDTLNSFMNIVIKVETVYDARTVLKKCLQIEREMGRFRTHQEGYQNRPIDIDLLSFENKIIEDSELIIPHPRIPQRKFILEPFKEIAPHYVLPKWNKTVEELYEACLDENTVIKSEL